MAPGLTLREYLEEWIDLQQTQLQPSTWDSYRANVRRYLVPVLGATPIHELRVSRLNRFYVDLLHRGGHNGRPLSLRTVRYVHAVLHKALEDARRVGLVERNVTDDATLPRIDPRSSERKEVNAWTAEELRAFLNHVDGHRHQHLWTVAAGTGMRRGELLGLAWRDVDLNRAALTVRHALSVVRRHVRLKVPKTSRSRTLHLDARAVDALARQHELQASWRRERGPTWQNEWDLVFTGATGRPLVPDVVTREFRRLVASAPVRPIRLHDVRHTHATLMQRSGVASDASFTAVRNRRGAGLWASAA